jgi:hypothetical protein
MLYLFVTILYWVTHLWNFTGAPWNQNGLFDDAAWDIYFSKLHVFHGPVAAAYFDSVGNISREVVFHYYITIFFKLFGYNLLVFNISLLVLGFVTVLFTTLVIHKMFHKWWVTGLSAIILNFFPLHFLQIFMGHRYAIVAPIMMVSYYFLYIAVTQRSRVASAVSGVFAALCVGSAIMGRQYLYGLIATVICIVCVPGMREKLKKMLPVIMCWAGSFLIAGMPLILYILFNREAYFIREQGLTKEFFGHLQTEGVRGILPYVSQLGEIFFSQYSSRRQFVSGFYAIPLPYYFFLIPGLIIAIRRHRIEIFWLSLIPIAGAFISGSYDFRVLMATPFWLIAMAMCLDAIRLSPAFICGIAIVVVSGLIPSIRYIWFVAQDPNSEYLLPHADVAVSRLVQDIAAGVSKPKSSMKRDEFNRVNTNSIYDILVTPKSAYAIMHLYLQNFNDKQILSFSDGGIELLQTPGELLADNLKAIAAYKPHGKDLWLIWEQSDKVDSIIRYFSQYKRYGGENIISGSVDGRAYSLYIVTIKGENIVQFQKEVAAYEIQ